MLEKVPHQPYSKANAVNINDSFTASNVKSMHSENGVRTSEGSDRHDNNEPAERKQQPPNTRISGTVTGNGYQISETVCKSRTVAPESSLKGATHEYSYEGRQNNSVFCPRLDNESNARHMSRDIISDKYHTRCPRYSLSPDGTACDGSGQSQQPILVRVNGQLNDAQINAQNLSHQPKNPCNDELHDSYLTDDIDFDYVRKRTKRYYVGGFKRSITEDKLTQYVQFRGLTVTWVNLWISRKTGRVIIRLNIEASENCDRIAEPGFWPRGVTCRPWMSKKHVC